MPSSPTSADPRPTEPLHFDEFYVDCAIARIDIDSKCWGSACTHDVIKYDTTIIDLHTPTPVDASPADPTYDVNRIAGVRSVAMDPSIVVGSSTPASSTASDPRRVFKVGAMTGKTAGIVRGVMTPGIDPISGVPGPYPNVIEIEFSSTVTTPLNCKGHLSFAEPGDSGAIVVDSEDNAIGMVYAADPMEIGDMSSMAYACHIYPVLQELDICIPTRSATTYGNCAAVDGSGTVPKARILGELPGDPATELFAGVAASSPHPWPERTPISDDERTRMLALRDELRRTSRGRALHAAFAQVRREIGYLVRRSRPVKVAWHRSKGPAFLAHVLNHLKGHTDGIPHEVDGVSRTMLLDRMAEVLTAHGSNPLRSAIERHGDELRAMASEADTVHDCLSVLSRLESVGATE